MSTPCLRARLPLLDRSPTEIQLGADEGLILPAQPGIRAALSRLDGTRSLPRIARETGLSLGDLRRLIDTLRSANLLAPTPSLQRPLVRVLGANALARAFAEAYAASPPGDLQLVDPAPPTPGLYAHTLPTAADTLRAHLRAQGHQRISTASHWYRPAGPTPDLTVIAFDRLECDRAITDTLLRADQPHLLLRPQPDGIVVGPLVIPGRTCCTRCMDLVRAQDPAWPRLLAQLCLVDCRPVPELLDWAVSVALLQVRAWLADGRPETFGATLEIRQGTWTIAQRHWPYHPDCGCAELHGAG